MKMSQLPAGQGHGPLVTGSRVEWTNEPGDLIYSGLVGVDYENGTVIIVDSVRLAEGPFVTWHGSVHRDRLTVYAPHEPAPRS